MPNIAQKSLKFPLAGVSRRRGYGDRQETYAAPWALNVRGVSALEGRNRGGSRPGLSKYFATPFSATPITALAGMVVYGEASSPYRALVGIAGGAFNMLRGVSLTQLSAAMLDDNGVEIFTEDSDSIVFDSTVASENALATSGEYQVATHEGKMYVADEVVRVFDPYAGMLYPLQSTAGVIPVTQRLIAVYRSRLILAGSSGTSGFTTQAWYASRQGDFQDWNFGAHIEDAGKAVAGQLPVNPGSAGGITAIIPRDDRHLVFACANSLWILSGDPADGQISRVSDQVGIIAPNAWAITPGGLMAFLSNTGVFTWSIGSGEGPRPFSSERVPDELKDVATAGNVITMAYDEKHRGFHLFITPKAADSIGTHWWLDIDNASFWPVRFADGHQPMAVARYESTGAAEVVLACKDGYLRVFNAAVATDDGTAFQSHVLLGPFRVSSGDTTDASIDEIHGVLANNSGTVTWRVMTGSSAETVTDAAVVGIASVVAGSTLTGVAASGSWTQNRNKVERPRARGPWVVVWLSSTAQWSLDLVAITALQLGRLRSWA